MALEYGDRMPDPVSASMEVHSMATACRDIPATAWVFLVQAIITAVVILIFQMHQMDLTPWSQIQWGQAMECTVLVSKVMECGE